MSTITAHRARHALGRRWDPEPDLGWLAMGERETYGTLRDVSRRQAWLLGRLLAKEVVLEGALGISPTPSDAGRLEICSRDGLGRSIAPRVFLDGRLQPWSLSIAHSEASILVALSCDAGVWVGADVVSREAFGAQSLDAWLTRREREWLSTVPPAEASILWAIKEATYKAVGGGGRFVPRRLEACAGPEGSWHALVDGRAIRATVGVATAETEVAAVVTVGGPPSEASR